MALINVESAKTSELLSFYNEHSDKKVNKFTNLETARRRVTALIENIELTSRAEREEAERAEAARKDADRISKRTKTDDKIDELTVGVRKSNAAGIAKSWLDTEVRDARLNRQGVIVRWTRNGSCKVEEYTSTHAAFEALGLPTSRAIRFRMKLKASGRMEFKFNNTTYNFEIV